MNGENFEKQEGSFEDKKREYFTRLALQTKEALKMHKKAGLLEKKEGKRDWGNVSEHCLVEVARARVFADKLSFSDELKTDLVRAAALHDFFKKGEKEIVVAEGLNWGSFEKASEESARQIKEAGFNERVVRLSDSVGHGSLIETEKILNKSVLSEDDLAYLVLHYIDDYTIGSDWARPTEIRQDGLQVNDLDRRVDKNRENKRYALLNEEGKNYLDGETVFDAQQRIGELVEQKLASILGEKNNQDINPKNLPQLVDEEIKDRIESES